MISQFIGFAIAWLEKKVDRTKFRMWSVVLGIIGSWWEANKVVFTHSVTHQNTLGLTSSSYKHVKYITFFM